MSEAWTWRPLREVTIPGSTWNPRTDPRPLIRYIDVSAVSRDELRIVSDVKHSADNAPSRARKIVKTGDTVFATVRPTLGRIAQIPPALDGEIVSTAFSVLRPNPTTIHPDFLYFAMQLDNVMEGIAAMQTGASYPAVRDTDVLSQEIPLPPLFDQQEIATALSLVRSAVLGQKRSEVAAMNLKRAATQTLFTRGLRSEPQKETEIGPIPESWEPRTISELCEIWSGGTPRKSVRAYWEGDIPWVSGKDLKVPCLDDAIDHVTVEGVESGSRLAPADAVLLLVRGMGLAKDLPISVINRPMAFNQDVKALVSRGEYSGSFLRAAVYSGKDRLLARCVTSAHGTMTLKLDDVENFRVPAPLDQTEAEEVVSVLDAIDRKVDLHLRKRVVLEDLFKALLHKLMTGEIWVGDLEFPTLTVTLSAGKYRTQ